MESIDGRAVAALGRRVIGVINIASGGCDRNSAAEMRSIFAKAGLANVEVVSTAPSEVETVLTRAAASADVLVVLGGDGTSRAAADLCDEETFLVPLPGGTMNRLPKAIFGDRSWRRILVDTLAAPRIQEVSGGKAGDHGFFVSALLGAPALWADAREAARVGDLAKTTRRALVAAERRFSDRLDYAFGETSHGSAFAIGVACPFVSREMTEDEPMFEAVALDLKTGSEAVRFGLHALFDDWRIDPSVKTAKVRTVQVTGPEPVPVMLDGESVHMGRCVMIRFVPLAFRALRPRDHLKR